MVFPCRCTCRQARRPLHLAIFFNQEAAANITAWLEERRKVHEELHSWFSYEVQIMCNFSRPFCVFWLDLVPLRWKFWWRMWGSSEQHFLDFYPIENHFCCPGSCKNISLQLLNSWTATGQLSTDIDQEQLQKLREACCENGLVKGGPLNFDVSQNMASRCVPVRKLDMSVWLEILRLGKFVFARIQFLYAIEFTIPMSSTISTNGKYVNAKHQCVYYEWWLQSCVLLFDELSFLHGFHMNSGRRKGWRIDAGLSWQGSCGCW